MDFVCEIHLCMSIPPAMHNVAQLEHQDLIFNCFTNYKWLSVNKNMH